MPFSWKLWGKEEKGSGYTTTLRLYTTEELNLTHNDFLAVEQTVLTHIKQQQYMTVFRINYFWVNLLLCDKRLNCLPIYNTPQ